MTREVRSGAGGPSGMPSSLADTVDQLDEVTRRAVLTSWATIGEEGRERYRRYLDVRFARSRRKRAELAVVQLIMPRHPLGIPGGGFGTSYPV